MNDKFDYYLSIGRSPNRILTDYYNGLRFSNSSERHHYIEARKLIAFAPMQFFKDLAEQLKVKLVDILRLFKNWKIVKFFGKIGWSFKRLLDLLRDGYYFAKKLKDAIHDFSVDTGIRITIRSKEVLENLGEWIKENEPVLAKSSRYLVAALLIFMWFKMAYTGDTEFDFDFSELGDALAGKYSLNDLLTTPDGLKSIGLTLVGSTSNINFPWPGRVEFQFVLSIITALAKYFGHMLTKESSVIEKIAYEILTGGRNECFND